MKKITIALVLLILIAAAFPIVGNSIAQAAIQTKIETLQENGIEVITSSSNSSYLSTKNHYEFLLKDTDKFLEYLGRYSEEQFPSYVNAIIDGVLIGADMEYSNLPFSKAISIDMYPLTLSSSIENEIKSEDLEFYKYLDTFLQSKGVLYHINYNLVSQDFDGYLKDIDESYTLKDSTQMSLVLKNSYYEGNGALIAPSVLQASIEKISLNVLKDDVEVSFKLNNIHTNSNFESQSTYLSSTKLDDFSILIKSIDKNVLLDTSKIKVNISSNTQASKAQMFTKSSFETFNFSSKDLSFKAMNFNQDIALNAIDKDSLEEFRLLVMKSKNNYTPELEEEIQSSLYKVLSHGLILNIADFSIKNIIMDNQENLDGFSMIASFELKADKDFANKVTYMPLTLLKSINTNIKLKVSKKIYTKLLEINPMLVMVKSYAKEDGESLVYEIKFFDGELRVNGKAIIN